jgi:hypothetical protein
VIEASVMERVHDWRGQDIFRLMLFRKAASCYHLRRMEEAIHILLELLRMDREDRDVRRFLVTCLRVRDPSVLRRRQALVMASLLMGMGLWLMEVLVIRNFFPSWGGYAGTVAWIGIAGSGGWLLGGMLWHRWRCERSVDRFLSVRGH